VTLTVADALLLGTLGLLIATGWILVAMGGLTLAKWVVFALLVAGGIELLFHPITLSSDNVGLFLAGLALVEAGLVLFALTLYQRPALRAAGRFRVVNWRDVVALSLWVAGTGCVMTLVHPLFGLALIAGVASWLWLVLRPEGRGVRTHVSVEVSCDPETAFALVGDPREGSRYIDDLDVDAPADQEVGVGYRYRVRLHRKVGPVFEDEEEIVESQPGRRIKERSLRHPLASGTYMIERAPAGTRIIYDYEGRLSVPQALLGLKPAVVIRLTATRQRIFGRLKELLEKPAA